MPQTKGACLQQAPNHHTESTYSFAWVQNAREAVLGVASVEDHAERAGFHRGRYGRWHCAVHLDRNASCTIRDGRIRCWTCGESWNVFDLHMLATGEPFLRALRAVAAEHGIRTSSERYNATEARRWTENWRAQQDRAYNFRAGFLDLADEILVEEKAKLFDPLAGPANESLILWLSRVCGIIRDASSVRFLVAAVAVFAQVLPHFTEGVIVSGARLRFSQQARLAACVGLLAEVLPHAA